ncbi:Uu.00g009250.m01.CDS01 [Anthostomella pinea]|uniref:Uu.00g009250.m01.CDS01 n=1 Tax=Anthostomella pinea TaxID=933095 RepID=A0AAI8VRL7_9PEZI|nr:Uu.00g009250.m01.CDS01 [Anthostomella pinea]
MNNLALVLDSQGKHAEAEQIHWQTLKLKTKVLGREHPDTLTSMDNLAEGLRHQGKHDEAEQMHRQTLELRDKVLGREHPDTLASMNNLAEGLRHQGKHDEAEQMHWQTLELKGKVLGRELPGTVSSMNNLEEETNDASDNIALHSQLLDQQQESIRGLRSAGTLSEKTFHDSAIGTSIARDGSNRLIGSLSEAFQQYGPTTEGTDDLSERGTVYTQNSNDSIGQRIHNCEEYLADRLYHDLSLGATDEEDVARVSDSLPRMLRIFAFKIAKEGEGKNYRDTMRFILKHRKPVANHFITKALGSSKDSKSAKALSPPAMPYDDKVNGWLPNLLDDIHDPNIALESETREAKPDTDLEDEAWHPEQDDFSRLVTESRAYEWLLSELRSELEHVVPNKSAMQGLSEAMFRELNEKQQFSRKSTPRCIDAVFDAEWSPHSFFEEQEYGVPPEEAVVEALVLVGTTTQAEGLACGEYLMRQWSESAHAFIQQVQSVVRSAEGTPHDGKLSDDTTLRAWAKDGHFTLEACGHPDSVVEIGEQLMWISCALRSSDFTEVGTCEPSLGEIRTTNRSPSKVSMHIELAASPKLDENLQRPEIGACWQGLFRNPLVVRGYPISLRCPDSALGLQLSLSTLMALVPNSRIVPYMGKLFIKRFSTLLVAVKRVDNVILWHAIPNVDGSYIYYHDKRVSVHDIKVDSSILQELAELKHVVGWTSRADNLAGTPDCNCRIKGSGLSQTPSLEVGLDKITIGISKVATANAGVVLGWRDKCINTPPGEDFQANVKFISGKFVVLYDVEDHRGFLLDGGTALLYLVRMSLIKDEKEGLFGDRRINDSIQLIRGDSAPRVRAMNTLWQNALLKLYFQHEEEGRSTDVKKQKFPLPSNTIEEEIESVKGSWVLLRHRVSSILAMLDQAINKQGDMDFKLQLNSSWFQNQLRLEGYDFQKLAYHDRANVQFAMLGPNSKAWLDLVRKIQAVTLFGRGFGDIIRHSDCPDDTPYMCPDWRFVPKGAEYLAMSNSTLEDIFENGDASAWRLIDQVYMSCPQDPFGPCDRKGQRCRREHFLINGQNKKGPKRELVLPEHGAVIIGHKDGISRGLGNMFRGRRAELPPLETTDGGDEEPCVPEIGESLPPSESSRSGGTSGATTSLATAGSTGIEATSTIGTTIEPAQHALESPRSMRSERSRSLVIPEGTGVETIALTGANSSGVSVAAEPSERSQPMDSSHLQATVVHADNVQEASQVQDPPSHEHTTVAAAPPPGPGQQLSHTDNSQNPLHGQKKSFREGMKAFFKMLILRHLERRNI